MCNHFVLKMIKVCLNIPLKNLTYTTLELFQGVYFGITSECICVIHGAGNCIMIMMRMNFHLKNLTLPCSV